MISAYKISNLKNMTDVSRGISIHKIMELYNLPTHNQNSNTECAKILIGLGWSRSQTRYRTKEDRFYLWFPPVQENTEPLKAEHKKVLEENEKLKAMNIGLVSCLEHEKSKGNVGISLKTVYFDQKEEIEDLKREMEIARKQLQKSPEMPSGPAEGTSKVIPFLKASDYSRKLAIDPNDKPPNALLNELCKSQKEG